MITISDQILKDFWDGELSVLSQEVLEHIALSEETKKFLLEVGLPAKPGSLSRLLQKYRYFSFVVPDISDVFEYKGRKYLPITDEDNGSKFCLEEFTSNVVLYDKDNSSAQPPLVFVNSDIKKFLAFIYLYLIEWVIPIEKGDEKDHNLDFVHKTNSEFNELDSLALSTDENYWGFLIEELEYEYEDYEDDL